MKAGKVRRSFQQGEIQPVGQKVAFQSLGRLCSLQTSEGLLVEMTHRGVLGGWDLRVSAGFSAVLLCGLFAFCRYLERENEFPTV